MPASGRAASVRAAVFYRFEGDRKVNETMYMDAATLARQIGLTELPL